MKKTLQSIAEISGVHAAAIFDGADNIVASALQPPYEDVLVREIANQLQTVRDSFTSFDDSKLDGMFQMFEEGFVVARRAKDHTIIAIATKAANVARLGVAMSVASVKVERLAGQAAPSQPAKPQRAPSQPPRPITEPAAAAPPQQPPPIPRPNPPVAASSERDSGSISYSTNTSGSFSMSMSWTNEPGRNGRTRHLTEDAVGIKVMQHTLVRLARLIGREAATGLLEEELSRIGATPGTILHAQFADLIKSVAVRIADPKKRETFMIQALGDTRTTA